MLFLFVFVFKQREKIDFFYGYEVEFIPVVTFIAKVLKRPVISRFQGTILAPLMRKKLWKLRYLPHYISIKQKTNLTIMTDDGTQGSYVTKCIRNNLDKFLFIKNGVDFQEIDDSKISREINNLISSFERYDFNFISVSRLQNWKRVDRSINVFKDFLKKYPNSRYIIAGEGEAKQSLEEYVKKCDLEKKILFTGGVNRDEINLLMSKSEIFLSHYELSNVGNPLWEAISNGCLVVTISNGDTCKIISDSLNGIISPEDSYLDNANKLVEVLSDNSRVEEMLMQARATLDKEIYSWNKRMDLEYKEVLKIASIANLPCE